MTTNNNPQRWTLIPRPATRPDPYPERPTTTSGARLHTPHHLAPDRKVTDHLVNVDPLPFTANTLPSVTTTSGRRPLPWASAGLSALGQLILAVAIGFGAVGPVVGLLICGLWSVCSLLLIAAQVLSQTTPRVGPGIGPDEIGPTGWSTTRSMLDVDQDAR